MGQWPRPPRQRHLRAQSTLSPDHPTPGKRRSRLAMGVHAALAGGNDSEPSPGLARPIAEEIQCRRGFAGTRPRWRRLTLRNAPSLGWLTTGLASGWVSHYNPRVAANATTLAPPETGKKEK